MLTSCLSLGHVFAIFDVMIVSCIDLKSFQEPPCLKPRFLIKYLPQLTDHYLRNISGLYSALASMPPFSWSIPCLCRVVSYVGCLFLAAQFCTLVWSLTGSHRNSASGAFPSAPHIPPSVTSAPWPMLSSRTKVVFPDRHLPLPFHPEGMTVLSCHSSWVVLDFNFPLN